jgi:hypothetical protein
MRRGPIVRLCWEQAARIRRLTQEVEGWRAAHARRTADWRDAQRKADGWRVRCDSLYEIADPDLRDEVLGVHNTLDRLPTTED